MPELEILGDDKEFEEAKQQADEQKVEEAELIEEEKDVQEEKAEEEASEAVSEEVKQVPLPELINERRARQEAQRQLGEFQEKQKLLDDRLNQINEKLSPKPSVEDDPFGALAAQQEEINKSVQDIRSELENNQKQTNQTNIQTQVKTMEDNFRQAHTDYDDAMAHLSDVRSKNYQALGIYDPAQQQETLQNELAWIIQTSLASNKNPAEAVYEIAKQAGFSQSQPGDEPKKSGDKRPLKEIAKGLEQKSLSSTGGGEPSDGIDLDSLSEMSEDEFNATLDKLEKESGQHPDKVWKGLHS